MTKFTFVRHGQTDWNLEHRVQGSSDIPLNETGRSQARAAAKALAEHDFDGAVSSDLVRAHETAAIILHDRDIRLTVMPELREKNYGTWEGQIDAEIRAKYDMKPDSPWGDGETEDEVRDRVWTAIEHLATRFPNQSVLVVSHGGIGRWFQHFACVETPKSFRNCEAKRFVYASGKLTWDGPMATP